MRSKRMWMRAAAALLALGLVAAACGDDGDGGDTGQSDTGSSTGAGSGTDSGSGGDEMTPQTGGSITVGMYSAPRGLDPTLSSGSGTAGGTEMIAMYDTVTRWNGDTRSYEMRTAESLESNDTFDEWTLKLKPGITFRDGTAYDAEAVRWNWERYIGPANRSTSRAWLNYVMGEDASGVTVVDDLTVQFKLLVPYSGFPALLGHTPGLILSPTAVEAALGDPTASDYADKVAAFNVNPVGAGAGPFELVSFAAGEGIKMARDDNYYGEPAYLDEINFVVLAGGDKTYDALVAGSLEVGFLRTPQSVESARNDSNLDGIDSFIQGGGMLLMNAGVKLTCKDGEPAPLCVGQPDGQIATQPNTANAKMRKAVSLAIDPQIINERVYAGLGIGSSGMVDSNFEYDPEVPGNTVDLDEAKKLVAEAKAEGHSGTVRLACTNTPERVALATAVGTMLESVGINAEVSADIDVSTQIGEIITKKDFDLGCWGLSMPNDDTAILALLQNFWSESPSNRVGYSNPAWDEGLNQVLAASGDADITAAYKNLAEIWNEDVPSIMFETVVERVAWSNKVHGIYTTTNTMFFLDKAWIEQ